MTLSKVKVFIPAGEFWSAPLKYVWMILGQNKRIPLEFVAEGGAADVNYSSPEACQVPFALDFYSLLKAGVYAHQRIFPVDAFIRTESGAKDYLATAFYILNCIQEYARNDGAYDAHGRFSYLSSFQARFGDLVTQNLVQSCFDAFCAAHPSLFPSLPAPRPSRIFLSHDIDSVHGALLQNTRWALKQKKLGLMFSNFFGQLLSAPAWRNMGEIMDIHQKYGFTSTFFWLVNRGKGKDGVMNADYTLQSSRMVAEVQNVRARGFYNGLHKSASDESFRAELAKLPVETIANRQHFLRISLPGFWDEMEASGLKMDASLGYAEQFGFRNGYGQPFQPFHLGTGKPCSFVEVPLNLMDGTFQRYMKVPLKDTATQIIQFIERNKYDCVISLLWHNTFFTQHKYSGYLLEYLKVLEYLRETGITAITPEEIVKEYLIFNADSF